MVKLTNGKINSLYFKKLKNKIIRKVFSFFIKLKLEYFKNALRHYIRSNCSIFSKNNTRVSEIKVLEPDILVKVVDEVLQELRLTTPTESKLKDILINVLYKHKLISEDELTNKKKEILSKVDKGITIISDYYMAKDILSKLNSIELKK